MTEDREGVRRDAVGRKVRPEFASEAASEVINASYTESQAARIERLRVTYGVKSRATIMRRLVTLGLPLLEQDAAKAFGPGWNTRADRIIAADERPA